MINKRNIIAALTIMSMTFTAVNASDLVQMDIKKVSDSAVDVTFYTTGISGTPMVTRKSNNKYVVLMPNVAGKNAGSPDLSAVKDIITDVDVKNVEDGMSGYTKVTFITTKPLNIKTKLQKAAPVTQEEKAAKAVIAQAKTHPKQTAAPAEPKKEVAKTNVTSNSTAPVSKTAVNIVEPKNNVESAKSNKIVDVKPPRLDSNAGEKFTEILDKKIPPVEQIKEEKSALDIKEVEKIEKISKSEPQKPSQKHSGWAVVVFPLLGLYLLAKMVKSSVRKSIALKESFRANLAEKPHVSENYEDIINDSELSWQERYQKFVEESKGDVKNRKYTFIVNNEQPLSEIDEKRIELENTLAKTPEIYENTQIDITEEVESEVKSEDEAIQKELGSIKLKAFAKPVSLHTSQRNRVKKSLPQAPKAKEGKFVKLQETALNASSRRFRDANLRVSDLISTGSQYLQDDNTIEIVNREQNYIMSSVDEYFALLDKEQSRKMTNPNGELSNKVAASLANVKPSINMKKQAPSRRISNPIAKNSNDENYMNGLIVKSGYNIDENRGFYIVNLDGVTALVGRIKEEIFVLKKFDTNVEKLQVRLDSENVYMVKAGDFKSLVDVDENKMGVLIEL